MSNLGPHIVKVTQPGILWSQHVPLYKRLGAPAPITRVYWDDPTQNSRIADMSVDETVNDILEVTQENQWVEVFNEVAQRQGLGLEQHADFMAAIVPILHSHNRLVIGFNFSVGNPGLAEYGDKDDFQYLYNRSFCGVDAIGYHAYWGPKGLDEPYALRYRVMHRAVPSHPPFILTECGRDAVEGGQSGWKASGLSADEYLNELTLFYNEFLKDNYVLGAVVFTAGPTQDWLNFSTDELDTSRFYTINEGDNMADPTVAQLLAQNALLAQASYDDAQLLDKLIAQLAPNDPAIAALIQDSKTNVNALNPAKFTF